MACTELDVIHSIVSFSRSHTIRASGRNCEYSGVQLLIPGYPCKSIVDLLPSFNPSVHCPSPTCADYLTRDPSTIFTSQPTDNLATLSTVPSLFLIGVFAFCCSTMS